MTLYNVHLYREMRLFFPGIEADTATQAAQRAAASPTTEAKSVEDCDQASDSHVTEAPTDCILDDLFHGCAFEAYVEIANACQSVPDSEAVRCLAYRYYEEELAKLHVHRRQV